MVKKRRKPRILRATNNKSQAETKKISRNKDSHVWKQDGTLRLIELWSEEECDLDKDRRQNAILRIPNARAVEGISATDKDITGKIDSLCVCYSTQRNKHEFESGAGSNEVFNCK